MLDAASLFDLRRDTIVEFSCERNRWLATDSSIMSLPIDRRP